MYPWLVIRSKKLLAKNNCSMNQLCSCNLFINGNFKTKRKLGEHNILSYMYVSYFNDPYYFLKTKPMQQLCN